MLSLGAMLALAWNVYRKWVFLTWQRQSNFPIHNRLKPYRNTHRNIIRWFRFGSYTRKFVFLYRPIVTGGPLFTKSIKFRRTMYREVGVDFWILDLFTIESEVVTDVPGGEFSITGRWLECNGGYLVSPYCLQIHYITRQTTFRPHHGDGIHCAATFANFPSECHWGMKFRPGQHS